jgi:hypothetical protein
LGCERQGLYAIPWKSCRQKHFLTKKIAIIELACNWSDHPIGGGSEGALVGGGPGAAGGRTGVGGIAGVLLAEMADAAV